VETEPKSLAEAIGGLKMFDGSELNENSRWSPHHSLGGKGNVCDESSKLKAKPAAGTS
jgi:hypothetical protein